MAYDNASRLTKTIDPNGYTTTKAYDLNGNVTQEVDGLGLTTLLAYDPDGNLCDGWAGTVTYGFFDVDNIPPWDTWLVYVHERDSSPRWRPWRERATSRCPAI